MRTETIDARDSGDSWRVGSSGAATRRGERVLSRDGTSIAFDRLGNGPALLLVDGAGCYRGFGPTGDLAKLLATHFTVFTYDRRGRGESGDTAPYAVAREVEDIEALLTEAGGTAFVWGMSSGGLLALEAARRLAGIAKLALYEAPLIVDDTHDSNASLWMRIEEAVAANRPDDAVKSFLASVDVPRFVIAVMRLLPVWSKLKSIAHTFPYDGAIVAEFQKGKPLTTDRWSGMEVLTLVIDGGKSAEWMHHGNRALALALPNAEYRTLDGQSHVLKPRAHVPTLVEFFTDGPTPRPGR